jgi:tetratricopeptide (TPR) repeat protein
MIGDTHLDWDRTEVDRLIAQGDHAAAADRIRAVLDRQPGLLPARMAEARLALATGDTTRAESLAAALAEDHPRNMWVWMLRIQTLARARRHDAAVAAFHDGLARNEPSEPAVTGALNALLAVLPMADQVALLRAALARSPDSAALQLRLAARAQAIGQNALAMDMLDAAAKAGPLPDHARRVRSRLYPFMGSMSEAADRIAAEVAAGASDAETLCRLCRFAAAAGRFDEAKAALRQALDLHPLQHRTVYRLNRVFLSTAEDDAVYGRLSALADDAAAGPSWHLQFALFALRCGRDEAGRQTLARLAEDPVVGPTARILLAALAATGPVAPRPGVTDDADMRIVRVPGATATIFLFGGFLGGLSHLPERYVDALLQQLPAHVVYLRDPHGRAYLNGIPDCGATEADLHAALRRLADDLGAGRIVALGGSVAGYAALRAGLAIGADRVISLAGLVAPGAVHPGEPDHSRQGLEELFGQDRAAFDLRPALRQQPQTRLVHVIGELYAPDVDRGRTIADLANAEVLVLPGIASHHVALPAITDGTLLRLLRAAMPG